MGGHYPTSRRVSPVISVPGGNYPALPVNRPRRALPDGRTGWHPATFDPGADYDKPGVKRDWGWPKSRPSSTPFGRKAKALYPSPLQPPVFRRLLPYGAVAASAYAWYDYWINQGGTVNPGGGWINCYRGGPHEMMSGPAPFIGCSFHASFQAGRAIDAVWPNGPWSLPASIFFGPDVFPANPLTRMDYAEQWFHPDIANGPAGVPIVILPPAFDMPNWPWLPLDPNFWLPLNPQPYSPNFPTPVWPKGNPRKQPRTFPKPKINGNTMPGASPTPKPTPDIVITSTGVSLRPNQHRRQRPHKPYTRETKYTMRGPFMGLARYLLMGAAKVYNGITELVDFLTAIYESLPAYVIAREPDYGPGMVIPGLLESIWRNADKIDMNKALYNLAKNQVEDAVWGKYFKAIDAVQKRGGPYYSGYDRELGKLNEVFQELYGASH